jgi:hypothetical protein
MKGDHIASIVGVSVPLILRATSQQPGRYMVVGPAFVDSLAEWGWFQRTKSVMSRVTVPRFGPPGSAGGIQSAIYYEERDHEELVAWPNSEGEYKRLGRKFDTINLV